MFNPRLQAVTLLLREFLRENLIAEESVLSPGFLSSCRQTRSPYCLTCKPGPAVPALLHDGEPRTNTDDVCEAHVKSTKCFQLQHYF